MCLRPPQASLVASDRLFGMKKQILEGLGLATPQSFPITREGFPLQLLSYLRLARLQDPAELAKVGPGLSDGRALGSGSSWCL